MNDEMDHTKPIISFPCKESHATRRRLGTLEGCIGPCSPDLVVCAYVTHKAEIVFQIFI